MHRSQLAINTVSLRGSLEEILAACAEAGFENVEFALGQVRDRPVSELRHLLQRHRLRCIGGFETGLEAFSDREQRAANHARVIENARLLAQLGSRCCLVVGTDGPTHTGADPIGVLAEAFATVADAIADTDVRLCLEFNWSPLVKSLRTAVEVVQRTGRANVGVLFDPAHYHCTPTKFEQINATSVAHIYHVHVDDMRDKPGELSHCNDDRVLPGQGCLDLRAIFDALERYGYKGYYSIEMFSKELWALPPLEAAKRMYDSLLPYCEETR